MRNILRFFGKNKKICEYILENSTNNVENTKNYFRLKSNINIIITIY